MGLNSPQALVSGIGFNNCMHFGLGGGKDQREVKWGNITLKTDSHGKEYLEYSTERQTKTGPGDNSAIRGHTVKPRMYENLGVPPETNPAYLYKLILRFIYHLTTPAVANAHFQKLNYLKLSGWESTH